MRFALRPAGSHLCRFERTLHPTFGEPLILGPLKIGRYPTIECRLDECERVRFAYTPRVSRRPHRPPRQHPELRRSPPPRANVPNHPSTGLAPALDGLQNPK